MADFKVTELDADLDFDSLPYWDVVIIGAGPAGISASLEAKKQGLSSITLEQDTLGGTHSCTSILYSRYRCISYTRYHAHAAHMLHVYVQWRACRSV